jgi:hypothetical protein
VSPSVVYPSPQNTTDQNTLPYKQKRAIQGRELPRIALNQIERGYSGEDEDIRSSWDMRICVYRKLE